MVHLPYRSKDPRYVKYSPRTPSREAQYNYRLAGGEHQHYALCTEHSVIENDNIGVFTVFMLNLYKHEMCNKKQALKALGLNGVKGLNLKPVGLNTVKTASRPNHLAWQRTNATRKLTAIRQSQQIEIFRLSAPPPPPHESCMRFKQIYLIIQNTKTLK